MLSEGMFSNVMPVTPAPGPPARTASAAAAAAGTVTVAGARAQVSKGSCFQMDMSSSHVIKKMQIWICALFVKVKFSI